MQTYPDRGAARPRVGLRRRPRTAPALRATAGRARRPTADGHRRPDRGPGRRLALVRGERLRRGSREVPASHVVVAALQGDADVEQGAHRASRPMDLSHRGRAPLGRRLRGPRALDERPVVEAQAAADPGQVPGQHRRRQALRPLHRVAATSRASHRSRCRGSCASRTRTSSTTSSTYRSSSGARGMWASWCSSRQASRRRSSTRSISVRSGGCSTGTSRNKTTGWSRPPNAPPERLYRPDISLLEWRRLVEEGNPFDPPGPDAETTES